MRATHWVACAGALGLLLGSSGLFSVRADEAKAVRLVEDAGGMVIREGAAPDSPVIAVSLCGGVIDDAVLKTLTAFPNLRTLDLCRAKGLTSKRVRLLADLKGLESLNVSRCPDITGHGMYKLAALKNLRSLDVSYCPEIDDCGLEALTEFFPKLESLNIAGCKALTARGLKELRNLCLLTTLVATDCDLNDDSIREVAGTTTLKHLSLAGSTRATVNGLKALAALTDLESLDLSSSPVVTSSVLATLGGKLTKLHTLGLANCPRMANHSLKALRNLKQLHTLNLAGFPELENYGLEYLVTTLPQLRALDISGCTDINDEGMRVLVKLSQLQTIDLRGCRNVSAGGAKALTDALPKLKLDR